VLHEPARQSGSDHAADYKSRLGVVMFILYALFYGGFVFINLYNPALMGRTVAWGMNLATIYGFALILVALVQALIYDLMCRRREAEFNPGSEKGAAN